MESEKVELIENKEARGFSYKNLLAIVICTAGIVATVIGTFSSLQAQIASNKSSTDTQIELIKKGNEGDWKYNDLRMKTLELSVQALELRLNEMQHKK